MNEEMITEENNQLEIVDAAECDKLPQETVETTENSSSSGTSESSDSQEAESSNKIEEEPPAKKRRKRKRRPKKKKIDPAAITAYVPDKPFTSRYNKVFLSSALAIPKVHLRFDNDGNADDDKSEFNYKPRLIRALENNLSLCEDFKNVDLALEDTQDIIQITEEVQQQQIISRKPRIIKAIVI